MLDAHRPALLVFFCKDTATTVIYTLSLHDALPIYEQFTVNLPDNVKVIDLDDVISGEKVSLSEATEALEQPFLRSEEHTSELQSRGHLVCRLLLEKKKTPITDKEFNTMMLAYSQRI